MRFQIKIPGDIESEINISLAPGAGCISDILGFDHTLRIGHDKLKNMSAGFNIPSK